METHHRRLSWWSALVFVFFRHNLNGRFGVKQRWKDASRDWVVGFYYEYGFGVYRL